MSAEGEDPGEGLSCQSRNSSVVVCGVLDMSLKKKAEFIHGNVV